MERLTKRIEDENTLLTEVGDIACKCFCDNYTLPGCWGCPVEKAIEKLADYEDAEEQGLLVRLPCKVGTEVFCFFPGDSHYTKCQIKKNRNLLKHIWKYMLLCRASWTKGMLLQIF